MWRKITAGITCFAYMMWCIGGSVVYADQMLDAAAVGQQTGMETLGRAVGNLPSVSTQNPTATHHSTAATIYLPEVIPGADPVALSEVEQAGSDMLRTPERIQQNVTEHWYNLKKIGCRQTSLRFIAQQIVLQAYRYLQDRQTGATQPYNTPWTLILGKYPTLGVTDKIVTSQKYDDTRDLVTVIELSPFPQPRDGLYFVYGHEIAAGQGGTITSYGTLQDGFAPQGSVTGTDQIAIRASLYRVQRAYLRNSDGSPPATCPPDPANLCNVDGLNLCDAKASGAAAVVQGTASQSFSDVGAYAYSSNLLIGKYETQPLPNVASDPSVARGVSQAYSAVMGTDPMASALFGGCTGADLTTTKDVTVHKEEIRTCSGVFTEADPCNWTRDFNFTKTDTKDVLTVYQYCKQPNGAYLPCPISVIPTLKCPGGGSIKDCTIGTLSQTWTESIDNNTYWEYHYTPFMTNPSQTFTWNDHADCAVGYDKCIYTSSLYTINNNKINNCEAYALMLWDGWCQGEVTCEDYRSCVTIADVTYCDGDPESQKIIEKMETKAYPPGHPREGTPIFPPMCWGGTTTQMECEYFIGTGECYTDVHGEVICPETDGSGFVHHPELCPGPEEICPYFKDDCEYQGLYNNSECKYVGIECSEDATGLYSGICYVPSLRYDCGKDMTYSLPEASGTAELCTSSLRCLGTECHNVRGETNADFGRAVSSITATELIQNDFVCAETGAPPTDQQILNNECTIRVFEGERMQCKIPIGHSVGLTQNCCDEGLKAASGVDAVAFLQLAFVTLNLAKNPLVLKGLSSIPGSSPIFEFFEGTADLYRSGVGALKHALVDPFTNAVEHLGFKVASSAAEETAKQAAQTSMVSGIQQKLMWSAYDLIKSVFGPELADQLFTVTGGQIMLNATVATVLNVVSLVFTIYSLLKILMSIIFRCEENELKLGIQRKMGNCTYVGSYCAQRTLFTCIVRKESYCCYNTPLARIIMEQARKQLGGFGSKRRPNCKGLTLAELSSVNWSTIDLSEWEARLGQAGILPTSEEQVAQQWGASNVQHLKREYGIETPPGPDGDFTKADANQARVDPHVGTMTESKQVLEESPYCYTNPDETLQYPYPPGQPPGTLCISPP